MNQYCLVTYVKQVFSKEFAETKTFVTIVTDLYPLDLLKEEQKKFDATARLLPVAPKAQFAIIFCTSIDELGYLKYKGYNF